MTTTVRAMDSETDNKLHSDSDNASESASFSRLSAVASGWILDFMFVTLCRHFKEGNVDGFNDTLTAFEAISQTESFKGSVHHDKTLICAFLGRVVHGKQLDVVFEKDESLTPLMSAARVWTNLEHTVEDEHFFRNMTVLLLAQSVAVCLEKGQVSSASSTLQWYEEHYEFPKKVSMKLKTIVKKMDNYHPFLMSFSFSRLQETVQSYLDSYLKKHPSDYLLKAAAEVVRSPPNGADLNDATSQSSTDSQESSDITQRAKKEKRKLLPTNGDFFSRPDTLNKTLCVSLQRLSRKEICQRIPEKSPKPVRTSRKENVKRTKKKWTAKLDSYLLKGVKVHGEGKWARILMDYDFEGRSGTMLKDRWRVLMRAHVVG